jgi:hypothetical protein
MPVETGNIAEMFADHRIHRADSTVADGDRTADISLRSQPHKEESQILQREVSERRHPRASGPWRHLNDEAQPVCPGRRTLVGGNDHGAVPGNLARTNCRTCRVGWPDRL